MSTSPGQRAADQVCAVLAQAQLAIGERINAMGQQLDHTNAQLTERRRDLAVEREAHRAALDVLDGIVGGGMAQAASVRPSVVELRDRLRIVRNQHAVTSPAIVGRYIRTGEGEPCWTVDTIIGERVRLPDGRVGIVHDAFGSGAAGVESITVEPVASPVRPGPGDLVYDLSPRDVEFPNQLGHFARS